MIPFTVNLVKKTQTLGFMWMNVPSGTTVLYLTPSPEIESGTGMYHKDDDGEWEMNIAVGNVYNRLIAYRGKSLYHRSIVPGFGNSLETID